MANKGIPCITNMINLIYILGTWIGVDLLGRAVILTTMSSLKAVIWLTRKSIGMVQIATSLAADYLDTRQDPISGRLLSWSESPTDESHRSNLLKSIKNESSQGDDAVVTSES